MATLWVIILWLVVLVIVPLGAYFWQKSKWFSPVRRIANSRGSLNPRYAKIQNIYLVVIFLTLGLPMFFIDFSAGFLITGTDGGFTFRTVYGLLIIAGVYSLFTPRKGGNQGK